MPKASAGHKMGGLALHQILAPIASEKNASVALCCNFSGSDDLEHQGFQKLTL